MAVVGSGGTFRGAKRDYQQQLVFHCGSGPHWCFADSLCQGKTRRGMQGMKAVTGGRPAAHPGTAIPGSPGGAFCSSGFPARDLLLAVFCTADEGDTGEPRTGVRGCAIWGAGGGVFDYEHEHEHDFLHR